jgi:hypothetical protein
MGVGLGIEVSVGMYVGAGDGEADAVAGGSVAVLAGAISCVGGPGNRKEQANNKTVQATAKRTRERDVGFDIVFLRRDIGNPICIHWREQSIYRTVMPGASSTWQI